MEIEGRVVVYASEIYARHIPGHDTRGQSRAYYRRLNRRVDDLLRAQLSCSRGRREEGEQRGRTSREIVLRNIAMT